MKQKKFLVIGIGIGIMTLFGTMLMNATTPRADSQTTTPSASDKKQAKSQPEVKTPAENFTLSKIKAEIERFHNIDKWETFLSEGDDTYKILATPENDGHGFTTCPADGEASTITDFDGNVIAEINPVTDPNAATYAQVRALIETLKTQ